MGHHNHNFTGDARAHTGVWGSPTSMANFCEEDYAVTQFVAEFINSLSNLAYVYFALKYPGCTEKGLLAIGRMDSLSVPMFLVGVTSAAFHTTLRQTAQLADDLSMLLLAGGLMQKLYSSNQSRDVARANMVCTWLVTFVMSAVYAYSGNLVIHEYTFGTMVGLIGLRLLYLIYLETKTEDDNSRLLWTFWKGAGYLMVAFALWNVDLEFCAELRAYRQLIGLPWAWCLELHGWWHVLTAVGTAQINELARALCDAQPERTSQAANQQPKSGSRMRKRPLGSSPGIFCRGLTRKSKADLDRIGAAR